jgi:hypothetical protein
VRHNAVLAVLPLLVWWALLLRPASSRMQQLSVALGLLLAAWSVNALLVRSLDIVQLDTWAVTPLFDLQAVSVATDQQLLPTSVVGPAMDVAQLRAAFHPYSATRLFDSTQSGVSNPTVAALRPQQRADLLQAWRQLPLQAAWWSHRLRLFGGLLGSHQSAELRGLADSPTLLQYSDNPPLSRGFADAHQLYRTLVDSLRSSGLYAPGVYLLLGLLALGWAWQQRRSGGFSAAHGALAASTWLYTLPYFVLAPSAETRYLLWPALASWLLCLSVAGAMLERNKR